MSKKHYNAIAAAIREEIDSSLPRGARDMAAKRIAVRLCETFMADNPRFDRDRFLTACGCPNV